MRKVTAKGGTEPVAYVTKGKHRVKQYKNSTVYLKNGDEFELELFNPTQDKVLAKIYLNETSIGAGIVLRPGERAFIERYIEESRKFMFQTYEVNGNNEEVKRAIANNGDVRVAFYKEQQSQYYYGTNTWTTSWPTWYGGATYTDNTFGWSNDSMNNLKEPTVFYSNSLDVNSSDVSFAVQDSLNFMSTQNPSDIPKPKGRKMSKSANLTGSIRTKKTETGRIDKGSHSDQSFQNDYSTFDTYWSWESKWKILPSSQKPLMVEDIKVFCTNCGAKQKKSSHKFCPHCGTEY